MLKIKSFNKLFVAVLLFFIVISLGVLVNKQSLAARFCGRIGPSEQQLPSVRNLLVGEALAVTCGSSSSTNPTKYYYHNSAGIGHDKGRVVTDQVECGKGATLREYQGQQTCSVWLDDRPFDGGWAVFGPYVRLERGRYNICATVRKQTDPNAAENGDAVLELQLYSQAGWVNYKEGSVHRVTTDTYAKYCFQPELSDARDQMEIRARSTANNIWIDSVSWQKQ